MLGAGLIGAAMVAAMALSAGQAPQSPTAELRPNPAHPERDRSAMQDDGCLTKLEQTESRPCVYGDPDSPTAVVLFGDSLAMQYFPAIEALAKEHDWRLVGLTKAGCPPIAAPVHNHRLEREYRECEVWREATLRRIERRERPELVLVSGRMSTPAMRAGRRLPPRVGRPVLERGYVEVLERLRATGAEVAVIKDLPRSPHNIPDCVVRSSVEECSFARTATRVETFDRAAAAAVAGVRLIDMTGVVCPDDLCRAVIGNAIVFRDYDHLTPTFARMLAPIFERRLGEVG
jgi:SGNH domain (fused to AT3 domains)